MRLSNQWVSTFSKELSRLRRRLKLTLRLVKTFRYTVPEPSHEEPIGILGMWGKIISFVSGEFLLNRRDNGGAVIAMRSLICSAILFFSTASVIYLASTPDSRPELLSYYRDSMGSKMPWFGAIFAAVYAALYARFASQWMYLANLYNQIKHSSLDGQVDKECLAEWKAGFIEDAEYLHLSHKENFVSVIHAWMKQEDVKKCYIKYTPGEAERWERLEKGVIERYEEINLARKKS